MTPFQQECIAELERQAAKRHIRIRDLKETSGRAESYIIGHIGQTTFWIYEDMADFRYGTAGRVFEPPDYANSQRLIAAFVDGLLSAVAQ